MTIGSTIVHNLKSPQVHWTPEHGQAIGKLRAVVLLAGAVRSTHLRRAAGRFVLDLPIEPRRSLLVHWRDQLEETARSFGMDHLPVRVMVDHGVPRPQATPWPGRAELRIECDPFDLRGTGGLLHDLASEYDDDDLLLVADAAQIVYEPMSMLLDALAGRPGDVRLLTLENGAPAGMMLIRCGALRDISAIGYIDFKEQALPAIARNHEVVVIRRDQRAGLPVRTLGNYLDALREYHRRSRRLITRNDPWTQTSWPTFSIIEPAAHVHPTAILHDAVVLAGAVVGAGAVLVRSMVCGNAHVQQGESVIDQLVPPDDQPALREAAA